MGLILSLLTHTFYSMTDYRGIATCSKTAFRLECDVQINIMASQERIWNLLTNPGDYPKWNSTILSADGKIALHEVIKVKTTLDATRTYKLKVTEFSPTSKMVWTDGTAPLLSGVRTFTLTQRPDGSTDFRRVDVYAGLLFPLIAGSLPDFKSIFELLAAELKAEAEKSIILSP